MANTAQLNGTYTADISKVDSVAIASIASISGTTWVSTSDSPYNDVINYGCMFDSASSTYMQYTPAAAGTEETWTYSCWVKRSKLGSIQILLNAAAGVEIGFTAADKLQFTTASGNLLTTAVLKDCSGWYHIVVAVDTTQATAADRVNIYINGTLVTAYDTETYMNQNEVTDFLKAAAHTLGANEGGTEEFDGYMAEFVLIDGTQYAASDFGETVTGIWVAKEVSGLTFGTYGTWLDFADSADLGDDNSGNTNDWTETNFGADHQVTDSPENNYCTYDDNVHHTSYTISEGGLRFANAAASWTHVMGTFLMRSGKWYWEVDAVSDCAFNMIGIADSAAYSADCCSTSSYDLYTKAQAWLLQTMAAATAPRRWNNNSNTSATNVTSATDMITQVAFDADNSKIWFGVDDTWCNFGAGVGDPAAGTNPAYSSADGLDASLYDYVVTLGANAQSVALTDFGQKGFTYTPPTGFKALCTENMTAPSIVDPQDNAVNLVLYTGTGAENAVTGVGFQPDMVWIKNRDTADGHLLFDSTRGATYWWQVDTQEHEQSDAQSLKSFDADGFTVGTNVEVNTNTENYMAMCFQKGATYGFDIVSYTGTGAAHAESHSLAAVPRMIVIKEMDSGTTRASRCYHYGMHPAGSTYKADPETDRLLPSETTGCTDDATTWNDTAPTTTQFTVGTDVGNNESGTEYIAYLWADIPGLVKCWAYQGNGNANGPYVYCGFRPRFIWGKNAQGANQWYLFDILRNTYNPVDTLMRTDAAQAESTLAFANVTANGFKIYGTAVSVNTSNDYHVGIAFADQPFNYANAF